MSRRCFPFRTLLLAAVVTVVSTSGPAARRSDPPTFSADASASRFALEDDTWIVDASGFHARVRQVDERTRGAFIRERTGLNMDPFATAPNRPPSFLSFLLEIENPSSQQIVFQPQRCRLATRDRAPNYPLDIVTLQSAYEVLGRKMPAAYLHVREALFDGEVVLEPGDEVAGLLVFRMLPPKTKWFRLEVSMTNGMGDALGFEAPYRKDKK